MGPRRTKMTAGRPLGFVLVLILLGSASAGLAADGPEVTMKTEFRTDWFEASSGYRMLLEAIAEPDPNVPGVTLSRAELDAALASATIGRKELKWVAKYASPVSRRRQRQRVRSVRSVLLSKTRLKKGRRFAKKHAELLSRVSAAYRVDVADLLAMLNAESNFGAVRGSYVALDVFVSQLAYLEAAEAAAKRAGHYKRRGAMTRAKNLPRIQRRRRYAVKNISALLRYAKMFQQDPRSFEGSWAGAIGLTQFMPASLRWAKDGDSNGSVDLDTIPDAVESTANYLIEHGYVRGDRDARRAAFRAYNPNSEYVSAIDDYAKRFRRRARRR